MKKHWFTFVLILMLGSVLGIGLLQWHWVNAVAEDQQNTFNRSVQRAASGILRDLEEQSTASMITRHFDQEAFWNWSPQGGDTSQFTLKSIVQSAVSDSIPEELKKFTREILLLEEDTKEQVEIIESPGENERNVIVTRIERKGTTDTTNRQHFSLIDRKTGVFFSALKNVLVEQIEGEPDLEAAIGEVNLDSLIRAHLTSHGISGDFHFGVATPSADSLWSAYSNTSEMSPTDFEYAFPIFPELLNSPVLLLYFPDRTGELLKGMSEVLILVGLFSGLILTTFAVTIFYILRQKKLSAIKSDFINNMTHEFKTPLATIGLAVDSIRHPNVKSVPAEIDRLSNIIDQENKRMHGHVERILQLAKMESGSLIVSKERLDLNKMLNEAAENMKLQAESRNAHIELELDQSIEELFADPTHLFNSVINLLDNALKYCEQIPNIRLASERVKNGIKVSVTDNGIGMNDEIQKRVTETFFRVQSGNLHDVKGFGLGLSYVREIVRLHDGELFIKSTPQQGSVIGFILPVL